MIVNDQWWFETLLLKVKQWNDCVSHKKDHEVYGRHGSMMNDDETLYVISFKLNNEIESFKFYYNVHTSIQHK